ncbi:ParR family transcriptional regulator [Corynebacterium phocae]|uniref:ParR family transcriptional regulator n=1 Tax=Corynebacterium phocae TaxID=161895 RepID=A0A1L7D4Y1_9CORY|nr:PadR family transcriptional regulator [Corynebacterium phocae]APT92982.1 ParR family transcriptional regulator [Corynebacterium phocae]KAA8723320.1 PadR family transcriptional regulator [Corynebacterium phocae]
MSIKHSLLALLKEGPSTASQLQTSFSTVMNEVWSLNPGQVAQTLTRLQRDGLVIPQGHTTGPTGRKAELYALTTAGEDALKEWFNSVVARPAADRDELVIKVALAASRADIDLITLLDKQRFATLQAIRELNVEAHNLPQTRTTQRLTLERRVFELEGQLRWLDRVESLSPHTSTQEG